MRCKLHFTQTEHEPQVWGTLDCDWAEQMREAYSRLGGATHVLVNDAESADIILFWEPHQDSQATWAPRLRNHPLVREFPNKAFVISVDDHPLGFLPGLYCSLPKRLHDPRRHRACFYHRTPNPYVDSRRARYQVRSPMLLASFIGARSHGIRDWLFRERDKLRDERIFVRETVRGRYSTDPTDPALESERLDYIDSILAAKFSLCPHGNGVGSFRLQESLALARPPVIISDDWVPVQGPDWQRIAVFVKERDIAMLPRILRKHEPNWREMGDAALSAYNAFFANGNYVNHIVDQIVDIFRNRTHDERDFISRWDDLIKAERRRRKSADAVLG